jgi:hypothetical protein
MTYRYSDPAHVEFLNRRADELHYTLAPARGSRLRSEGAIAEGVSAVDLTYGFDDGSRLRSAAAVAAGLNPRDPYALYGTYYVTEPEAAGLAAPSSLVVDRDSVIVGIVIGILGTLLLSGKMKK